jgi:hypothetical protein
LSCATANAGKPKDAATAAAVKLFRNVIFFMSKNSLERFYYAASLIEAA